MWYWVSLQILISKPRARIFTPVMPLYHNTLFHSCWFRGWMKVEKIPVREADSSKNMSSIFLNFPVFYLHLCVLFPVSFHSSSCIFPLFCMFLSIPVCYRFSASILSFFCHYFIVFLPVSYCSSTSILPVCSLFVLELSVFQLLEEPF